jgi:glycerate 2-kinase
MIASDFLTHSLETLPWGESVCRILLSALQAVDPAQAVRSHLQRRGDFLDFSGDRVNLSEIGKIYVVGAGKAGAPMALCLVDMLGDRLSSGIIIVKDGYQPAPGNNALGKIEILQAGHPIPDQRGVQATNRLFELLNLTRKGDLVICLISGGGSALLVNPVPGVSLEDIQILTEELLSCGANIQEINTLRKHLDQVKGGNLARHAAPANLLTMILSDVVGNPVDIIASGPTVPDPSTFADANAIIQKYDLSQKIPSSITTHLKDGEQAEVPETPKPSDPLFKNTRNVIIGSNIQAANAAIEQAQAEGFHTLLLTTYLQGEARQAGKMLAAIARQIDASGQPIARPACLVAGGETTVTLQGNGKGGRNQEVALGAVEDMAGLHTTALVTLATDGSDGPTDAAGAVVTGETFRRGLDLGINPEEYLRNNDAYQYFKVLGDLLVTGPTYTNVNDLNLLFLH